MDEKIQIDEENTHLSHMTRSYKEGFTIHGLTKIFLGHSIEKIVWFFLLVSCLVFVGHETYYFYEEFKRYDIRTEVRMTTEEMITLPAITICNYYYTWEVIEQNICWKNGTISSKKPGGPCNKTKPLIRNLPASQDIIGHPLYTPCIIINSRSRMMLLGDVKKIRFALDLRKLPVGTILQMYIHNADDISFPLNLEFARPAATIKNSGIYKVLIENRRNFQRLKYPYPSNCTMGSIKENALGGIYSINKCKDTCTITHQRSVCGTTLDHWKQYITSKEIPLNSSMDCHTTKNKTEYKKCDLEIRRCLDNSLTRYIKCHCPLSCFEEMVDSLVVEELQFSPVLQLTFSASSTLTSIQEVPVYPANKFITDIGSWLGLFSGMSVLSIAEIIIFLVLSTAALIQGRRRHSGHENIA